MRKNNIEEIIKGDWKIFYILKEDEIIIKNQIRRIGIVEYQFIHISTNKIVKTTISYEKLIFVGLYYYFDCMSFSEDGLSIRTIKGEYNLSEFLNNKVN